MIGLIGLRASFVTAIACLVSQLAVGCAGHGGSGRGSITRVERGSECVPSAAPTSAAESPGFELQRGDLLFQDLDGAARSDAIEKVSHRYRGELRLPITLVLARARSPPNRTSSQRECSTNRIPSLSEGDRNAN